MPVDAMDVIPLAVIGLIAGLSGGLLGFGGAIVVIPALTLFGYDQHFAQAVAMIVNIFVALPALVQHHRAGTVRWDIVARVLPVGLVMILVGVEVSDRLPGDVLRRAFGLFLVYLVVVGVIKLGRRVKPTPPEPRNGLWPTALVGGSTGFLAGLLGIGGGPVAVPLLHRVCGLPIRYAIGAGSAIVCLVSIVGAARKNAALLMLTDAAGQPMQIADSIWISACIAPTAITGALIGATLTHKLPEVGVQVAFLVLLSVGGAQMLL